MQDARSALPPLLLGDPLDFSEHMIDVFADSMKIYWWTWGPPGETTIRVVEAWAGLQRRHLELLQTGFGARAQP